MHALFESMFVKKALCVKYEKKKYKIDAEAFVNNNSHIRNENNTAIFKKNHLILNVRLVHPYITDR